MRKLLVARAAATAFGRDEFSLLDAPGNIAPRFAFFDIRSDGARAHGSRARPSLGAPPEAFSRAPFEAYKKAVRGNPSL